MGGQVTAQYLDGLLPAQAAELARVNEPGLRALREYLASGQAVSGHLTAAAAVFRDGDYLTELASTLVDLAEHARVSGDLDGAECYATEAIAIAAPRGLVPAQCAALAVRARIRASRAIRLAVRHELLWCELDALRAHALLDRTEGINGAPAAKADALNARLVPPGLDPDPPGTVERLVAAEDSED